MAMQHCSRSIARKLTFGLSAAPTLRGDANGKHFNQYISA